MGCLLNLELLFILYQQESKNEERVEFTSERQNEYLRFSKYTHHVLFIDCENDKIKNF